MKECDTCMYLASPIEQYRLLLTDHWDVGLNTNQFYLGRALATLRRHESSLGGLTLDEWKDFADINRLFETIYGIVFSAAPLNWGCFMNHAFREKPHNPHVHWHLFPRYEAPAEFDGLLFPDNLYGRFYDNAAERVVSEATMTDIAAALRSAMSSQPGLRLPAA